MYERVDEWLMSHLHEFDGKNFQSVAKGALDLDEIATDEDKAEQEKAEKALQPLVERVKKVLDDRVEEVRVSHRLTDSPACVVVSEGAMSPHLERLLKQAGQEVPHTKPVLELNPEHAIVKHMERDADDKSFEDWSHMLLDQAMLAEGGQLDDPAAFVQRLNKLLLSESHGLSD
jgi:molecular chaperone HtpG